MSFQYEGQKCPVCHAYLFEEDDIVCCPDCGAPHHRDCYGTIGHCALEDTHGTEQQYHTHTEEHQPVDSAEQTSNDEIARCQMCGEEYERTARSCPRCGAPNFAQMNGYGVFDFLGGVPAELDLGEGVTADEAKRFVMANTTRYIPKFAEMKNGKKTSWNWLAFLFPCGWFCSRKMYRNGILAGLMQVAFQLLLQPLGNLLNQTASQDGRSAMQLMQQIVSSNFGVAAFAFVGAFLLLIFHLLMGLFGDYIYSKHVIAQVNSIKEESEDADEDYHRLGGVNLFGLLGGILAVNYLPAIIFSLIR
ncbi:MAG: DUF2628 domain-containing protein [Clostridia bacterium]|nr:DUF2628 domain-containing protein [Clostridia bacterium]